MFRVATILTLFLLGANQTWGHTDSVSYVAPLDSLIAPHSEGWDNDLPDLDTLIAAALANSPAVRQYEYQVAQNQSQVMMRKREWGYRVFTDLGAGYSNNYQQLTVAGTEGGFDNIAIGSGNNLRAGVSVKLSLFDLTGRKHLIDQAENEMHVSEQLLQVARQNLQLAISDMYVQLKLAQKLVIINSNNYQTLSAQMAMAEKQFTQGEIPLAEYARITDIASGAEVNFENAKAEYESLYRQMEILIGCPLIHLIEWK